MSISDTAYRWIESFLRFPSAGLDISDERAKIASFSFRNGIRGDFFSAIDIPRGIIEQGEIKNEEEFVRVFQEWAGREKKFFRSHACVVALPEEKGFVRLLDIPKIKAEEVGSAIRWQVETNIPLKPEELYYDYQVIERGVSASPETTSQGGHPADHLEVMLIAYPRVIVDSYTKNLLAAGIRLAALECESQAVARALLSGPTASATQILIDMGRTRTGLAVVAGGALIFTTTIPVGGATLEEMIAKELNVEAKEAARLKKEVGLDRAAMGGSVFSSLVPTIAALASEIRQAMEFYQNWAGSHGGMATSFSSVVLSGGDANLLGLDTYLAATLRVPVVRGDPFAGIRAHGGAPIPSLMKNEALGYTTAIGLALRE